MSDKRYAKVVMPPGGMSFEQFRDQLAALAHPGVDVGLLQVGVHEALLRPHLALHLAARAGQPLDQVLTQAGAARVELLSEAEALALSLQRVPEDLQPRPAAAAPGGPLWHLKTINVEKAWAALGGPDAIDWTVSGVDGVARPIMVGQIDTGYTRHVAFGHGTLGGSWIRADRCRTIMASQVPPEYGPGPAQPDDGVDPMPFGALNKGHGTRIGATLSGHAALPGGGRYHGVAPKVPHVMVRITDSVAINTRQDEFVQAMAWLVDVVQVDVINISLGIYPPVASPAVRNAMAHARKKGVIVVCAAGNLVDQVVVPARLDTAIAVAGTTWDDRPWSGSSYGPQVAFSAPADGIFRPAAQKNGIGSQFEDGGDGTSYAAAMTSGSAALWLRCWGWAIDAMYGRTAKRVEAFKAAVQATCRRPPDWQPQPFGVGILDTGRLCTDIALALPAVAGSFPMPGVPAPAAQPVVAGG